MRQTAALRITNFRVPAYVPITLPANKANQPHPGQGHQRHPLDLAKPILFDCDYEYKPEEDAKLTVRWFRNKEPEPFYQWLPELEVRHLADWIRPLVNQSFVADPLDPMKRYRSLLIKRLSMNLTGHYSCVVSSLANQDTRQASLVVYQPPQSFTFKQTIYPAPAPMPPAHQHRLSVAPPGTLTAAHSRAHQYNANGLSAGSAGPDTDQSIRPGPSPTQFKGYHPNPPTPPHPHPPLPASAIVRPPNNNNNIFNSTSFGGLGGAGSYPTGYQSQGQGQSNSSAATKIVYTHDGRPIRRKSRQTQPQSSISGWQLRKRLGQQVVADGAESQAPARFALQLHHFQCQATQVTPRPVIVLTVKRGQESIAQYLHESSTTSIRPYQVSHADYFESSMWSSSSSSSLAANSNSLSSLARFNGSSLDETGQQQAAAAAESPQQLLVTLYDITVSATVALNVSLQQSDATSGPAPMAVAMEQQQQQSQPGINTVLSYRRGQRMSFECFLEITGTEFEQRKRINIDEEEVYQFAEAEERKRKLRLQVQQSPGGDQGDNRMQDQEASLRVGSSRTRPMIDRTLVDAMLLPSLMVSTGLGLFLNFLPVPYFTLNLARARTTQNLDHRN